MAKKKRISKSRSAAQNNRSERAVQAHTSKGPGSNTPYIIIIASLLLVIAYLLSGGGQNQGTGSANPPPGSFPDTSTFNQPVLYTGDMSGPNLKPEFAGFFPDNLSGMRCVKLQMDPLNEETGGQFASKIAGKANVLYLSDSDQTDFEVEFSVYKMESPEAAKDVLNFYISQWNKVPAPYGNFTFWVWNGYEEQLQAGRHGRPSGVYIYWDTLSNSAFLPIEGRHGTYYLSMVNQTLYCRHGEAVQGEYFIMVDVHAPLQNLNEFSDQMFAEAAKKITSPVM